MIRYLALATLCALAACNQPRDPAEANNAAGTTPANQAEQDRMSEGGYSSERSSGPSGIADTNLGTTGQTNAVGASPGADAKGSNSMAPAPSVS